MAFQPDGKSLAAAGADGMVRLIDAESGKVVKEFAPAPLGAATPPRPTASVAVAPSPEEAVETETLPPGAKRRRRLEVQPPQIKLTGRFDYVQLLVTGKLDTGETVDVTRMVEAEALGAAGRRLADGPGAARGRRPGDAHG